MPHTPDPDPDGDAPLGVSRRQVLSDLAASAAWSKTALATQRQPEPDRLTDLGMKLSADQRAARARFVTRHITVGAHRHPGRFCLGRLLYETPTSRPFGARFVERALADLDANFRPILRNYRAWTLIPAAPLASRSGRAEAAAVPAAGCPRD